MPRPKVPVNFDFGFAEWSYHPSEWWHFSLVCCPWMSHKTPVYRLFWSLQWVHKQDKGGFHRGCLFIIIVQVCVLEQHLPLPRSSKLTYCISFSLQDPRTYPVTSDRIAIFHGQYNEPRSAEDELRQQLSDAEAQYFWVDDGSVRASMI